jgi:hypothetical protein
MEGSSESESGETSFNPCKNADGTYNDTLLQVAVLNPTPENLEAAKEYRVCVISREVLNEGEEEFGKKISELNEDSVMNLAGCCFCERFNVPFVVWDNEEGKTFVTLFAYGLLYQKGFRQVKDQYVCIQKRDSKRLIWVPL